MSYAEPQGALASSGGVLTVPAKFQFSGRGLGGENPALERLDRLDDPVLVGLELLTIGHLNVGNEVCGH